MYRHVVLFQIKEGVPREVIEAAMESLRALIAVARSGEVAVSEDSRKGTVIVEDVTFASRDAFLEFRSSEQHHEVAVTMRQISEWLCGDWVPSPGSR